MYTVIYNQFLFLEGTWKVFKKEFGSVMDVVEFSNEISLNPAQKLITIVY